MEKDKAVVKSDVLSGWKDEENIPEGYVMVRVLVPEARAEEVREVMNAQGRTITGVVNLALEMFLLVCKHWRKGRVLMTMTSKHKKWERIEMVV